MQLNSIKNSELVVTAKIYAAEHGITEHQVIKYITTNKLPGYQTQGVWYVRLEAVKQHKCWTWKQILSLVAVAILVVASLSWLVWMQIIENHREVGTLAIEVKIKDLTGTLHPVTGSAFFLISKDLEDIANEYMQILNTEKTFSHNNLFSKNTPPKWVTILTGATALRSLLFDISSNTERINVWDFRQNFEKSKLLWNNYVVQKVVTDVHGKARFEYVPIQEYWVVGWTGTATGLSFWKHWINLKLKDNQLSLRPENAAFFR